VGRLNGFSGRDVRRVAEAIGWQYQRMHGDHMVFWRSKSPLNLSIPDHREVREGTLRRLIRIMGLTVDEFLEFARK